MLHLFAALAEKERRLIGQRTKDALQAAKARGVALGGMREINLVRQQEAQERAERLRSVFEALSGLSAHQAAAELNRRGVETPTGKP
jgi:DNA invertase Pin-like site-specific DNA recombinase